MISSRLVGGTVSTFFGMVSFTLPKAAMGFYDNAGQYRLENGLFRIFAGGSSRDCLMQEIRLAF